MNIALIAHDSKKELLVSFCTAYQKTLSYNKLWATDTTGKLIATSAKLSVARCLSGPQGGIQYISSKIACNEIDVLFFFRDPLNQDENSRHDDVEILRVCDMHNIPMATNIATGEALIHALERGDLDWRKNYSDELGRLLN
ncbi:MAG: methylglyoxal synthase [Oscillospiraceae bacterium]|nr:methylglyoxal synthase [Oscillospiraceae bacterium]